MSERDGPFWMRVLPIDRRMAAPADQSLLKAAQAGATILPSSCRNGTCRTCLCRLRSGAVRYRVDWPGVSAEERAEGWILPCVALPLSDVVIEQPWAEDASAVPVRRSRRPY